MAKVMRMTTDQASYVVGDGVTNAAKVDASDDQTTIRQRLLLNPVLLDFSTIAFDRRSLFGQEGMEKPLLCKQSTLRKVLSPSHPIAIYLPQLNFSAS